MSDPVGARDASGLCAARFRAVVVLFAVSGGASLVDQVCFSKYLSYVVGSTAYAVSAVLAAFMTGLALGARLGGWISRRARRPVVAYGGAEIVVGLAVALAPLAFAALTPAYVALARSAQGSLWALNAARWGVAVLFVIVPTIAMGMTLPLVAPALGATGIDPERRRWRLGALYAANTVGGAFGALLGAYAILPALGLSGTLYASASVSALAGVAAILVGRRVTAPTPVAAEAADERQPDEASRAPVSEARAIEHAILAFASGALVFVAEVVATHLLAVIVGNSAYAFGLILAVFLACLFLAALLAPAAESRLGPLALPGSLLLSAAAIAVTLPLWDDLPILFGGLGDYITSFAGREAMRAGVAFGILFVPVTCMGLTFPLLLQRVANAPDVGDRVGRLTAVNTVGAVVGAIGAGYAVLPALGSRGTLAALAVIFAALALLAAPKTARARGATLAAGALASALAVVPSWDIASLTRGTNVYFDGGGEANDVVFVREDVHGGITTVTRREDGLLTLYTNGKFQGNTGWEMNAQRYFAHYPCLFVEDFDRALIIGLGTGTTAGTLAAYPWDRMDLVEISPSIALAAKTYFSEPNRGVLTDDPRLHLTLDDARNWLLVHGDRFDLISMELSSVWFAGASSLYSREFYELVEQHLDRRGVFQQWVQLHHVYEPVFATMLNTVQEVFDHVILFYGGGQGIVVAANHPLQWSPERAERLMKRPEILDVLPYERPLASLLGDILILDEGLSAFVSDVAGDVGVPVEELVSTDDNLYLEYETPKGNVLEWQARERLVERLRSYRSQADIGGLALN